MMSNQVEAKNYFNNRDYKMEVIHDSGIHRHLKFTDNGKWDGHFFITTWPDHLCISGDMGTFVFSRIHDMVNFFSGEYINPEYWEEKVQSQSRFGDGCKQFVFDNFHSKVKEELTELTSEEYDEETIEKAQDFLNQLESIEEDEYGSVEFMRSLDISELDTCEWHIYFDEFTFHYLFACYAINFACNTYLASKTEEAA